MDRANNLTFAAPSFAQRLKGMLGVDFYRLFHTPMYYIFLAVAAIIPAMVLSMTSMREDMTQLLYTNAWQMIAASAPLYVVKDIADYANMNMVFIFGGIMVSVFIGHDYKSGYVKQLFTTHAKKRDYMTSKSIVGAFSMACMCVTYLLGTVAAGILSGVSFEARPSALLLAILSKMLLSAGWSSLYTFINVILRRHFGVSIAASFLLGTGVVVIGAAAVLGNSPLLNMFLYGSSVYACLSSSLPTLCACLAVSAAWTLVCNMLGSVILSRSDVY